MKQLAVYFKTNYARLVPGILIGAYFAIQAAKTAVTGGYPLPYDESFHFGLIKLYTQHLNPFMTSQPNGADIYGAVARDPSYLYHYIMSFPLRLFDGLGLQQHAAILGLRYLNVALGLSTLYLVYKLARQLKLSSSAALVAVGAMAITPVFYDVAGQINYDNLVMPIILLSIIAALRLTDSLKLGVVSVRQLASLGVLLMAGTLVKYSVLPVACAIAVYSCYVALRYVGIKQVFALNKASFKEASRLSQIIVVAAILITSFCWAQRYAVNLALYSTPHPQCNAVLSVEKCMAYSPWARNYTLHQTAANRSISHVTGFSLMWVHTMFKEIYSTVYTSPDGVFYRTKSQLMYSMFGLIVIGTVILGVQYRIFSDYKWRLIAYSSAAYVATLWLQNYSDYRNLHEVIAVQGRYLLPVLPFIFILLAAMYENSIFSIRLQSRQIYQYVLSESYRAALVLRIV